MEYFVKDANAQFLIFVLFLYLFIFFYIFIILNEAEIYFYDKPMLKDV